MATIPLPQYFVFFPPEEKTGWSLSPRTKAGCLRGGKKSAETPSPGQGMTDCRVLPGEAAGSWNGALLLHMSPGRAGAPHAGKPLLARYCCILVRPVWFGHRSLECRKRVGDLSRPVCTRSMVVYLKCQPQPAGGPDPRAAMLQEDGMKPSRAKWQWC